MQNWKFWRPGRPAELLSLFLLFFPAVSLFAESSSSQPFFHSGLQASQTASTRLSGSGRNFSDVIFEPASGRYLILDDYCQLIPAEVRGAEIHAHRTIRLNGLQDCEAAAYVRPDDPPSPAYQVAVGEERGRIATFRLAWASTVVDCPDDCEIYEVEKMTHLFQPNSGLEAVAVDARNPEELIFYAGREHSPRKFYRGTFQNDKMRFTLPWDAEALLPPGADIAGATFFAGRLFLLDEQKGMIREVDPADGRQISEYALPDGGRIKYEGLAFSIRESGVTEMMIVAEPDRVFIFQMKEMS